MEKTIPQTPSPHSAPPQWVERFIDPETYAEAISGEDTLLVGTARIAGRDVLVAVQDSRIATGTLALKHFAALVAALEAATAQQLPVVFFLDTAGVRVSEAAGGELGFRAALHALCRFRAAGGRGVSVVAGRIGCFGAGAGVAGCLGPVLMAENARMGIAGPKSLEAAVGVEHFDASDRSLVMALMGPENRLRTGEATALLPADADAAKQLITAKLAQTSPQSSSAPSVDAGVWRPDSLYTLPDGQQIPCMDGLMSGTATLAGRTVEVVGILPDALLTKDRAERLLGLLKPQGNMPLLLIADAQQVFAVSEDRAGLTLAYTNLAERVAACRGAGRRVVAYGAGGGSGAAFVVLAMMADAVALDESAVCHAVPPVVASVLLRADAGNAQISARELYSIGGIEAIVAGDWSAVIESLFDASGSGPRGNQEWCESLTLFQRQLNEHFGQVEKRHGS